MNNKMKTAIKDMKTLFTAWQIIQNEYDDGEEKEIAQKVIDNLIMHYAEEVADNFDETVADADN